MPDLQQTRRWFAGVDTGTTGLGLSGTTIGAELGPRVMRTSRLAYGIPRFGWSFFTSISDVLCVPNLDLRPPCHG